MTDSQRSKAVLEMLSDAIAKVERMEHYPVVNVLARLHGCAAELDLIDVCCCNQVEDQAHVCADDIPY